MHSSTDWYFIRDTDRLDTPCLVIYPERVKANIRLALQMASPERLRPHVKTNKSPQAVQLMLDAGITRFKCATIAEAEMLGMLAAPDVLLAYQPQGPKLERFIQLINRYPRTQFACLTDSMTVAQQLSAAFSASGIEVRVFIDLDTGMHRTGIPPGPQALALYQYLQHAPGIKAAGLHAYDGHIRDKDVETRTIKCNRAFETVMAFKHMIETGGGEVPVIIAGGSPSFPIHAARPDVECSPGTFIYWDKGYSETCAEQGFLPAAVLVSRIISLPGMVTITSDLGHKSIASENEISRRISWLNAEGLTPVGHSEEHLVMEAKEGHSYKAGDVLYGLPFHVCPTVALFERAFTIEDGRVSGEWIHSARDRKIRI